MLVRPTKNPEGYLRLCLQVQYLRTGRIHDIHITRLKYDHDASLDKEEIILHVPSSETGMHVSHLTALEENNDELVVHVRWHGLPEADDTYEPLARIQQDVPLLL